MTTSRLITRSACALGAAILATTALQSTLAEARGKAGSHTRASAHSVAHAIASPTPIRLTGPVGRLYPGPKHPANIIGTPTPAGSGPVTDLVHAGGGR